VSPAVIVLLVYAILFELASNPAGTTYKLNVVVEPLRLQKYIVVIASPLVEAQANTFAAACPESNKTLL
jgi:hypothetical protein